jgi:DNA-binding response OmpR family regulator
MRDQQCGAATVMVVEGVSDAPKTLAQWLRVNGYQVMEETNLEKAMENAADYTQRERPDLILLSLSQVPADDLATIDLLRDEMEMRKIPIVAILELGGQSTHDDAVVAVDSEYFDRPENTEQLTNLIENLLHRSNEDWDVDERKSLRIDTSLNGSQFASSIWAR